MSDLQELPPHRHAPSMPGSGIRRLVSALVLLGVGGAGVAVADPLTVAFLGDQGTTSSAETVLQLTLDEGADLLVIAGDLAYGESPGTWGRMMDDMLGDTFPVLSVAGNHDRFEWEEYERWLEDRIDAVDGLECSGAVGVKAHCRFRGLSIVQTAPGVAEVSDAGRDDDYEGFIDAEFSDDPAKWRVCSFHKNMRDMQVGGKGDATGWGVYEACRRAGAMIATGHEHSYSRTYLMEDFDQLIVARHDSHLVLEENRSFAFVSGLGGHGIRDQEREGDWWASIYAEQQGAEYGALFCRFEGDLADCEFKSVGGAVPDRFTLETRVGTGLSLEPGTDVDPASPLAAPATDSPGAVSPADVTVTSASDDLPREHDTSDDESPETASANDDSTNATQESAGALDDASFGSADVAVDSEQNPRVETGGGGGAAIGLLFLLAGVGLRRQRMAWRRGPAQRVLVLNVQQ